MNKITFIVGESGSGKTYLRDKLIKNYPELYCEIRSTVSRPPRESEDETAYHFISKSLFGDLILDDKLLQHVSWGGNYYGTTLKEYDRIQDHGLFICTPVGISDTVKALRDKEIDMEFSILLFFTTKELLYKHGTSNDRISRGKILEEFLSSYVDNDFEDIPIDFITDKDIDDDLHKNVDYLLRNIRN